MNTPPDYLPQPSSEESHRLISVHTLINAFCLSAERFPITLAYLLAFTVWGVFDCWFWDFAPKDSFFANNLQPALWFLTTTGMPLSLAVSLWCEQSGKSQYHKTAQWIANILLLIDFVYIVWNIDSFTNSDYIAHLALITSLIVAIIFVPAIKRAPRRHNLMFSVAQFSNIISALRIALIIAIAILIIGITINALFNFESINMLLTAELLFSASLSILIFISRVPTFEEIVELVKDYEPTKFAVGVVKYVFLPLTAIYTIVLYAYGLKIIISGEFPNGIVCTMVTALTAAVYLLLYMLKAIGSTVNGEDRLTKISLQVFPIALIPLLVMMSVAIGQRLEQYGMTVSRLYVLTFNIWAYITVSYLYITRSRNINNVALSFAVVFLVTSIIPGLNYTSLIQNHMRSVVVTALKNAGIRSSELPVSRERFAKAKDEMDETTWADVRSKMLYLDEHDSHSLLTDIIDFKIEKSYYVYDPLFVDGSENKDIMAMTSVELFFSDNKGVEIPTGYANVKYISNYRASLSVDKDHMLQYQLSDEIVIPVNFDSIRTLNSDSIYAPIYINIGKKYPSDSLYIVSSIDYSIYDVDYAENGNIRNMRVKGYLFTR